MAADVTSLYIHVPFCLQKCPYCDFFSVPVDSVNIGDYADLLISHLRRLADQAQPKKLESIFFGGGTPSLMSADDIARILATAEQLFGFTPDTEISLEANPGTVSANKLRSIRAAGVNRLSLGIQSLCESNLHLLERKHSAGDAEEAIRLARAAGFANLSCDLMFALPGQTPGQLQDDLERILVHEPEHLAIYGLTIEEGTPFARKHEAGDLLLPGEDDYVLFYRQLHDVLQRAGYRHYEISNFARPGFECRHNLRYWHRRENLAIGAGAHSFRESGWGERWAVADDLSVYRSSLEHGVNPEKQLESFSRNGAMFETLYLALRTADGIDAQFFQDRFGIDVGEAYPEAVRKCGAMLRLEAGSWRMNLDGWLLFNTLLGNFS